jgi:hypothetical protein
MARDIIISAFATPPQARARAIAQPTEQFKEAPHIISLAGIGSDIWMAPTDTQRAPREPWGGTPFAREAAMYREKGGGTDSVLAGLLGSQAKGIEPRRICLIGFSAGGTFVGNVLKSATDRKMVDMVILLDALMVSRSPAGFVPQALAPWAEYGAQALMAGVRSERGTGAKDPFLGPVFVSTHTNIKQSASLEAQVGNTTSSTEAVFEASAKRLSELPEYQAEGGTPKHITTNWAALVGGFPPDAFPVTIGDKPDKEGRRPWATTPGPTKTWTSMPGPTIKRAYGNFYDFDYGGTVAADHVLQAWHVQRAIWQTLLVPRWNAETTSPYSVAGLGGFERCCPGPGGNFVPAGFYPTGLATWQIAATLGLGFLAGKYLMD